jgi:hypothetical protein
MSLTSLPVSLSWRRVQVHVRVIGRPRVESTRVECAAPVPLCSWDVDLSAMERCDPSWTVVSGGASSSGGAGVGSGGAPLSPSAAGDRGDKRLAVVAGGDGGKAAGAWLLWDFLPPNSLLLQLADTRWCISRKLFNRVVRCGESCVHCASLSRGGGVRCVASWWTQRWCGRD